MFLSDEGPTLKTLDFTIYIGSTPTFLYFYLYLNNCLRSTLSLFISKLYACHLDLVFPLKFLKHRNIFFTEQRSYVIQLKCALEIFLTT